jgi:hypothetical protein
MTKAERENRTHTYNALMRLGFTFNECERMRRISMTLHRWHELECGDHSGHIERDETTGKPYFIGEQNGRRYPIADRETGAHRRLSEIIRAVNERRFSGDSISVTEPKCDDLSAYIQGDPRGAALYILRPGDVPEGEDPASYYSRGICVY